MRLKEQVDPSNTGLAFLSQFPTTELCVISADGAPIRAKVDTSDLSKILAVSTVWRAYWHKGSKTHYVMALRDCKKIPLHRVVTDAPDGLVVDHIEHDALDNRKSQLRVVAQGENVRNARYRIGKGGIRGAHPVPSGRYQSQVRYQNKYHYLGTFDTPEEAGNARLDFLRERGLIG